MLNWKWCTGRKCSSLKITKIWHNLNKILKSPCMVFYCNSGNVLIRFTCTRNNEAALRGVNCSRKQHFNSACILPFQTRSQVRYEVGACNPLCQHCGDRWIPLASWDGKISKFGLSYTTKSDHSAGILVRLLIMYLGCYINETEQSHNSVVIGT